MPFALKDPHSKGKNSMVATDGVCYISWIAQQYGLQLEQEYSTPESCTKSNGDKSDINRAICG